MPQHPTIAGCHFYELDFAYDNGEPRPAPCAICGARIIDVCEIDVEAYRDHYPADDDDSDPRQDAIAHLMRSTASPEWVRQATPQLHDGFVIFHGNLTCRHQGMILANSQITGIHGRVYVDNRTLSPQRSQQLSNHSPSGFSWGYGGSGPAQLALAILLEAGASDREAIRFHQDFKWAHIATLPQDGFQMPAAVVHGWLELARNQSRE